MNGNSASVILNHVIWDYQHVERCEIKGVFDKGSLADALIAEWIPYFECHKCGRADFCKHVIWSKRNPSLSKEIQCGIARTAIENLVSYTFESIAKSDHLVIQEWLDGAYHLAMYIYKSEIQTGNLIDHGVLEFWGEYVAGLFGQVTRLREHLDGVALHFGRFRQFRATERVLFVEGWSEKAFIERLKESRLTWFLYKHVEVYAGAGNRRPKRIQMLLDKYIERGYEIYIQGDADGRQDAVLAPLVEKCHIAESNTFVFKYDFESSIPSELLYSALRSLGELEDVTTDEFREVVSQANKPVSLLVKSRYGLDLDPIKMSLAEATADLLNETRGGWSSNERFIQTELGQFLRFIQRI